MGHGPARRLTRLVPYRALEGLSTPPSSAFGAGGTLEGALFLVSLLDLEKPHLVERARRELSKMLGNDIGGIPADLKERSLWATTLRDVVRERWEQ